LEEKRLEEKGREEKRLEEKRREDNAYTTRIPSDEDIVSK
jgi:hypothetical protein